MMQKLLTLLAALAGLIAAGPALAQESAAITQARQSGVIGERYDGYLGFVTAAPAGVRRQVNAINIRRRSLYYGLAARKGVTPEEVGITAACSLFRRLRAGEYYFPGQGGWQRYAPGRSAVPAYCG